MSTKSDEHESEFFKDVPKVFVEGFREKLDAFAKEHGWVIREEFSWKIRWMMEHEGRCACDPYNRKCPCPNIFSDLQRFKGNCLCRIFYTPEKMEKIQKEKKRKKLIV